MLDLGFQAPGLGFKGFGLPTLSTPHASRHFGACGFKQPGPQDAQRPRREQHNEN